MKQTLLAKMDTTKEQFDALIQTMHRFNQACNFVAPIAFKYRTANKMRLQPLVYRKLREKFGLSAQMAIRAIAKVCEAYKRDKSVVPKFRPDGAMVYDQRILSWKGLEQASILTLNGRIRVPIRIGDYQKARMDRIHGQADLLLRKGVFYLAVVVDAPEPTPYDPVGVLGVDLGIVNLAVDSDGTVYKGEGVDKIMGRCEKLKVKLQRCGTKSAKRHLKRLSGREKRFRRNTNHNISKRLVAKAVDTGRMLALEDLGGIRSQTTVRKAQRRRHDSWGFGQLRSFIEYKAALAGVPVVAVEPRGTSHTCPTCGCLDKRNRPSRESFKCVSCGFAGPADYVAALNIAARAVVSQPTVSREFLSHFGLPQGQATLFKGW
jgi:IS605 OrfB family transposase